MMKSRYLWVSALLLSFGCQASAQERHTNLYWHQLAIGQLSFLFHKMKHEFVACGYGYTEERGDTTNVGVPFVVSAAVDPDSSSPVGISGRWFCPRIIAFEGDSGRVRRVHPILLIHSHPGSLNCEPSELDYRALQSSPMIIGAIICNRGRTILHFTSTRATWLLRVPSWNELWRER